MGIESRQQAGARRRTAWGAVELGEADTARGQRVEIGRWNLATVGPMSDQPMSSTRMTMMFGRASVCAVAADALKAPPAIAMAAAAATRTAPAITFWPATRETTTAARDLAKLVRSRFMRPPSDGREVKSRARQRLGVSNDSRRHRKAASYLKSLGAKSFRARRQRQPLVRRSRRFEVDVVDAGLRQRVAEGLGAGPFGRADAEEQHLDLRVECRGIGERAAADRLRVGCVVAAPEAAAVPAEAADVGELVEVRQASWRTSARRPSTALPWRDSPCRDARGKCARSSARGR